LAFFSKSAKGQAGCTLLCNPDFENQTLVLPGNLAFVPQANLQCWNTTAPDGIIEMWGDGMQGVPAFSGTQFIELNANYQSTLFQNFNAFPGSTVTVTFAHRGRWGTDQIGLRIGPVGGPYTNLGVFTTGNTAWQQYTVNYTFPNWCRCEFPDSLCFGLICRRRNSGKFPG
jgi:hypothetical protein